jgi:hypothetical protein
MTVIPAHAKARPKPAVQSFDAAATVTALVETRAAILAIVTQTPGIPGISDGSTLKVGKPITQDEPIAQIVVAGLNIRNGPGTNYSIINSAKNGERFRILGQAYQCEWLQISQLGDTQNRSIGWIAGTAQYTSYLVPCAAIAVATIPATPTPLPRPTATAQSAQQGSAQQKATEGCYILRNELGFALKIMLTGPNGWQDSFQLAIGAEREYCAPPGTYQYTLTAPAPLGTIQGTLTVNADERLLLPLKFGN